MGVYTRKYLCAIRRVTEASLFFAGPVNYMMCILTEVLLCVQFCGNTCLSLVRTEVILNDASETGTDFYVSDFIFLIPLNVTVVRIF